MPPYARDTMGSAHCRISVLSSQLFPGVHNPNTGNDKFCQWDESYSLLELLDDESLLELLDDESLLELLDDESDESLLELVYDESLLELLDDESLLELVYGESLLRDDADDSGSTLFLFCIILPSHPYFDRVSL
jgi:hypothetical protein